MRTYDEMIDELWSAAKDARALHTAYGKDGDSGFADLLEEASCALSRVNSCIAAAAAKEKLLLLAKINIERERLYKELHETFLEDCDYFDATQILYNCTIDDEGLKDAEGEIICCDGRCMDDPLGYFVEQWTGYCEDDYHGTMYFPVDDNGTVVVVSYSC